MSRRACVSCAGMRGRMIHCTMQQFREDATSILAAEAADELMRLALPTAMGGGTWIQIDLVGM